MISVNNLSITFYNKDKKNMLESKLLSLVLCVCTCSRELQNYHFGLLTWVGAKQNVKKDFELNFHDPPSKGRNPPTPHPYGSNRATQGLAIFPVTFHIVVGFVFLFLTVSSIHTLQLLMLWLNDTCASPWNWFMATFTGLDDHLAL